jgi:hypothetical protein
MYIDIPTKFSLILFIYFYVKFKLDVVSFFECLILTWYLSAVP